MIRAVLLALLLTGPAIARDNNPFSGATSIRVTMHRDHHRHPPRYCRPEKGKPFVFNPVNVVRGW